MGNLNDNSHDSTILKRVHSVLQHHSFKGLVKFCFQRQCFCVHVNICTNTLLVVNLPYELPTPEYATISVL